MRFALAQSFLLSVFLSSPALASDVSSLLKKMSSAGDQLNYQGVLVLRKSDNLVAMSVEHGSDERGVWESMMSLNGEARRVVRLNDEVTSVYPERQLLTISRNKDRHNLHPALPENLDKLEAYYTINRLKDDRVADHHAVVLDVVPKDPFRYGYRYWLDSKTGVLLRCDLINEKKHVLEQMMFTRLDYLTEAPASAFTAINHEGYEARQLDKKPDTKLDSSWQVSKLPAGFMLTRSRVRETKHGKVLHLAYSDGLASVSVFVEPMRTLKQKFEGASTMGALNAFGIRTHKHFIMVVGEVPAMAVMHIARSVSPSKATSVESVPAE